MEILPDWQGKLGTVENFESQDRFVVQTETLDLCTNTSDYLKNNSVKLYGHVVEPLENSQLDGFMVRDIHLDNITPGPEAYILNCPYLIRLGLNSDDFPNPDTLFQHIVSSVKIWPPAKNSQL